MNNESKKEVSQLRFNRLKSGRLRDSLKRFYYIEFFLARKDGDDPVGKPTQDDIEAVQEHFGALGIKVGTWTNAEGLDIKYKDFDLYGYRFRLSIVLAEDEKAALENDSVMKVCMLFGSGVSFSYKNFLETSEYEKRYFIERKRDAIEEEIRMVEECASEKIRNLKVSLAILGFEP